MMRIAKLNIPSVQISKLLFRGAYITCKSVALSQRVDGLLSRRNSVLVAYYLDLVYDVLIDCVELLHYTHMLVSMFLFFMFQCRIAIFK